MIGSRSAMLLIHSLRSGRAAASFRAIFTQKPLTWRQRHCTHGS